MIVDIIMPVLGETTEEAEILEWFKNVGDFVKRGEVLLEVQSDKVTVEIPALQSGKIKEIVAPVGSTISVGAAIAILETEETEGKIAITQQKPAENKNKSQAMDKTKLAGQGNRVKTPRLRASPAARRLAREHSIALAELAGSGPLGRITKADVLAIVQQVNRQEEAGIARIANISKYSQIRLSHTEIVAGKKTQLSFNQSPHFYLKQKIEITKIRAYLKTISKNRPSINDILVLATAKTLKKHPRLNSIFKDDYLQIIEDINIGVITATEEGLYTSVVQNADHLSVGEIKLKVKEIRQRLQNQTAKKQDIEGAGFCISNLGMFGIDEFSAIILPPNVAIMAVGTAKEELIVKNGQMHIGETISCTVSADHRALDGVMVAKFLKDLEALLNSPESWLF